MKHNFNDGVISNLKDTIDALIEKGIELSKDLSIDEQYGIMKKLIHEGVNKATSNVYRDEGAKFTKEELKEKKEELEQFIEEYFDKKFSEYRAINWEKKR
jgi:hypothetical protein